MPACCRWPRARPVDTGDRIRDTLGGLSARQHALYFFVAFAAVLLIEPFNPIRVMAGSLADPDSYMRLIRIQEALDQGRWFGTMISRDGSGSGLVVPWSHVFDFLILRLRAPLLLVLPPTEALLWAGAISGPISVGLLGLVCAWTVAPLVQRGWLWTAPLAAALALPIGGYGQLGCVTHHVALVVLAVGRPWAVCGADGCWAYSPVSASGSARRRCPSA